MSGPWYRKPLCWAGLCETFRTNGDQDAVWGECSICGKTVGRVERADLHRHLEAEARARGEQS